MLPGDSMGGSPDLLVPWLALGIWFAVFSWLGTGTMIEKWARKKGFEKLVKKDSSKMFMLSILNAFVEAFFVFLTFLLIWQLYPGFGRTQQELYWYFYGLLGIIVQIPVRIGMALTMNLPERFLLIDMVGGIFKYLVGGAIILAFAPLP